MKKIEKGKILAKREGKIEWEFHSISHLYYFNELLLK